ncbi:MAG: SRPBCC family protein [Balneolaceae bacterium]
MNIKVNNTAKACADEEILINASAKRVYKILADIKNWPVWQSSVTRAEIDEEPAGGSEFIWKAGGLKIHSRLHTVNPFTEFGWTGRMMWIKAIHNWRFEETDGNCLVKVEESLEGFLAGFMKNSLQKGMIESLKELKAEAEKDR